jgi:putative glutamine amidotransferase
LIGVTKPDRGGVAAFWAARLALALAGARTRALTADTPGETLALDGLMLAGGSDVHPSLFRAAPKASYPYDRKREAMELAWLRRAWAEDLPTLGVCRGAQLMNVAAGGTLHLDMAKTFPQTRYPSHWLEQIHFRKRVVLEPGSRLAAIVGGDQLHVNSIHSQAVSHLGEDLRVSARETNGAIQAIEAPSRRFWLGVQFHPEFLIYRRRCLRIFRAFVDAAAEFAATRAAPGQPRWPADADRC